MKISLLLKFKRKFQGTVSGPLNLKKICPRDQILEAYLNTIAGPGGMPIGTNGKAMLLLSGGIDSPVAGYMIAKRGVKIDAVYFHAPPYTSERAKQKVVDLAKLVANTAARSVCMWSTSPRSSLQSTKNARTTS